METNYKNLIILGNGFDLYFGLPTKWSDFVEFYEVIIGQNQETNLFTKQKEWSFDKFKEDGSKWIELEDIYACLRALLNSMEDDDSKTFYKEQVDSLIGKIKENKMLGLLSNFRIKNKNSHVGHNWNNFEHLIEDILDSIDEYVNNLLNKSYPAEASIFMSKLLKNTIEQIGYKDNGYFNTTYRVGNFNLKTNVINSKTRFLNFLFTELMEFTSIYRSYIDLIVDRMIQMNLKKCIHIDDALILSFNYTQDVILFDCFVSNTFFVHGRADNTIIIGISNEQQKEERIKFSKNYMRVYNRFKVAKNEDNINQISSLIAENTFTNYFFIGHSIDKIDHSFLRKLYENGRQTKTTIFYYSEDDKNSKIFNLYLMLGEDYITQMLNQDKLEFVKFDSLENYIFE